MAYLIGTALSVAIGIVVIRVWRKRTSHEQTNWISEGRGPRRW